MTSMNVYDLYEHHEMVRTDGGEVIELYTCIECGAIVRAITIERHASWHLHQQAVTIEVQAQMIRDATLKMDRRR